MTGILINSTPYEAYDAGVVAGRASRDAEIAGLNQRIDMLSEASLNIIKERDQLRKLAESHRQATFAACADADQLRKDVESCKRTIRELILYNTLYKTGVQIAEETLAEIEQKP